jgi:hypothetical protein
LPLPVAPVMSKLRAWRSQSPPASAVISASSSARLARQLMSSMQAALTLSLAALSSRATRRSSRQATSRCTSSVSRSSKPSACSRGAGGLVLDGAHHAVQAQGCAVGPACVRSAWG